MNTLPPSGPILMPPRATGAATARPRIVRRALTPFGAAPTWRAEIPAPPASQPPPPEITPPTPPRPDVQPPEVTDPPPSDVPLPVREPPGMPAPMSA